MIPMELLLDIVLDIVSYGKIIMTLGKRKNSTGDQSHFKTCGTWIVPTKGKRKG
jgi:hypothetical protein